MKEYEILRYSHDGSVLFHRTDCFRRRCSSCVSDFGDRCPKCGLPQPSPDNMVFGCVFAKCGGCGTKLKVCFAAAEPAYVVTGWDEPTGLFPSVEEYDTI